VVVNSDHGTFFKIASVVYLPHLFRRMRRGLQPVQILSQSAESQQISRVSVDFTAHRILNRISLVIEGGREHCSVAFTPCSRPRSGFLRSDRRSPLATLR
jgi:hypothetical protein